MPHQIGEPGDSLSSVILAVVPKGRDDALRQIKSFRKEFIRIALVVDPVLDEFCAQSRRLPVLPGFFRR